MVNVTDEIQIRADAKQAISELDAFRKAAQQAFSGEDAKSYEKSLASVERTISKVAAAQAKLTTESTKQLRVQKELESAGLKKNSAGQYIGSTTGRFASKDEISSIQQRLSYIDKIGEKEGALERMRGINAQNEYQRFINDEYQGAARYKAQNAIQNQYNAMFHSDASLRM